jgi:hypothetical protein|nr:MAG TPA: KorB domain [Bacteriophage sp.]
MSTTKNTTNQEVKNNSIINVTVNGMTANDTINNVKSRLESVEKSAFNIALLCAYGTGVTIPEYTDNKGNVHGEATCDKPIKQNDYIKLVGRSKATLSRWIKAMNLIIENNRFNEFASGLYPFSYDKIIDIFENTEVFDGYVFKDLMDLSACTLATMIKDYIKPSEEKSEETATDSNSTEEKSEEKSKEPSEETAVLTYQGKDYTVNKAVFEKWLAENATLAK